MRHDLRHRGALVALVASALFGAPAAPDAQSTERQLIVTVVDDDGAPVAGLTPSDFEVREDGVAREVLRAGPAGDQRHIALLVDTGAGATEAVSELRNGLSAFIDGMIEGNQISLITFGGPPRILVESTTSAAQLREGVGGVFPLPNQAAYLLDAMARAADGFERQGVTRPVLVALTTEGLDYSNTSARRVLERIETSGAAVYTLLLRGGRAAAEARSATSDSELRTRQFERDLVLERGPRESGGRHRDLLASLAIERAMRDLVTELRQQYLVVYARPDALIPPDTVDVRVTRAGLTARGTPVGAE